ALNWGFAGAISVLLLAVVLVVFVVYDRMVGLSTMTGGSTANNPKQHGGMGRKFGDALLTLLANATDTLIAVLPKRKKRAGDGNGMTLRTVVTLILVFLSAPAFLMIPLSFDSASGLAWPPHGVSLQWYQQVMDSPLWMQA
ncbi:ABC transporter permease, partial [Caballeronia sp. LZ043]|nr:ABC transporter permease [Caballeronia sp. LZ043]MDR5826238.1 ABC transporter permease [Caballeronia sp. LZ043]